MIKRRMDAAARKRVIVETAMPLFARKGFTGTTTKELAEKAGVSEALLYRHFPTKAALYEEIQQLGSQVDPALDALDALAPSTAILAEMVQAMFQHIVFGAFDDPATSKIRQRLMLQSLLEDGEYARVLLSKVGGRCLPIFETSLAAACKSGDLRGSGMDAANAFWFAGHVACQIAQSRLPGSEVIPYRGTIEAVTAEAIRFCLRGIGLTEEAIERHCKDGLGTLAAIAGAMKEHPAPGTEAHVLSAAAAMATSHDSPEEHRAVAAAAGRAG
jgi:TetR/AcrR family transcriptional regulator, transcriptional repressor of aconitase